ncbi:rCG45947, partial [Rattus norvegicus]
MPLLCA